MVLKREISDWCNEFPIINQLINLEEVFWQNPNIQDCDKALENSSIKYTDIIDASKRLERFAPYIECVFPETTLTHGIIESPLKKIDKMKADIIEKCGSNIEGNIWLKCDSHLPISGSIKARGGIYEVLTLAESIALESGMLKLTDNYIKLADKEFVELFSKYSVAVGSTGNLGLSIGIMSAKLGFKATVHMSADARQWKKDMLRQNGVEVKEYQTDYSKAVEAGREQSMNDSSCHFVDDENSKTLFLGYAVAALRLKNQLSEQGIKVDENNPLFVYLPCGVGGGPGGVAFGIKSIFGNNAHCFFAEPTHSPCMLLGLSTGYHDKISVQDFGIDNKTAADGLAVGRASSFVGKTIEPFLSGSYTISDEGMYSYLSRLADSEGIYLEPSALAGMRGIELIEASADGEKYLASHNLSDKLLNTTHIVWATGGSMVPKSVMQDYYKAIGI